MNWLLVLVLVAMMVATLFTLIRGVVNFLRATEADLKGEGPSNPSLRSNKLMQQRILFQAGAIVVLVLLLMVASAKG